MPGTARVTTVEDRAEDGEVIATGNLTSFLSNSVAEQHFVGVNEVDVFYVDRAKALELAEHFVAIANDLAVGDRFNVKPHVVLADTEERSRAYSVAFNDGINSERRILRMRYQERLLTVSATAAELLEDISTER